MITEKNPCICCDAPGDYNGPVKLVEVEDFGLVGPFCLGCIYNECHLRKTGALLGHWVHGFSWERAGLISA